MILNDLCFNSRCCFLQRDYTYLKDNNISGFFTRWPWDQCTYEVILGWLTSALNRVRVSHSSDLCPLKLVEQIVRSWNRWHHCQWVTEPANSRFVPIHFPAEFWDSLVGGGNWQCHALGLVVIRKQASGDWLRADWGWWCSLHGCHI